MSDARRMSYRELVYPTYSSVSGLDQVLPSKYEALAYNLKPRLQDIPAGARVLDIGSGQGEFLELCRELDLEAEGIDVSPELAEACRKRGLRVTVVREPVEFLRSSNSQWRVISMIDVLEHFTRDEAIEIVQLIRGRALENGGKLILQIPNMQSLFAALNLYHDITHEWSYTEVSITQLLRSVGFTKVTTYPQNAPFRGKYIVRYILRKLLYLMIHLILIIDQPNRGSILTPNLIVVAEG
jgi:predicted TPR repeat methyltransferase